MTPPPPPDHDVAGSCQYSTHFRWYGMEVHEYPSVGLRLKVRMLKAGIIETVPYVCITWSPSKDHCDKLRHVHHPLLVRCLGWRKRSVTTTPSPMPTLLSRRAQRELGQRCAYLVCVFRYTFGTGAPAEEGDVWGAGRGQGLHPETGEGVDEVPKYRSAEVRHHVRTMVRSSTEGWQMARPMEDGAEIFMRR